MTVSSVFVGKKGSGKTSYLAALWSTLKNAEDDELPRLNGPWPSKTQFLDDIEHALLTGRSVERTRADSGEQVRLSIRLGDESSTDVTYLDVAGESIASVLLNRRAPDALIDALADATATILFLHPENDTREMPMLAHKALTQEGQQPDGELGPDAPRSVDDEVSDETIWSVAPSAAHLVELLQVCQEVEPSARRPIAVIVSAWDLVQSDGNWGLKSPAAWLAKQLPLLNQYLEANEDRHPWRVFGISAQGADSGDAAAMQDLLAKKCADRTVVVEGADWSRDITAPLRWLIEVSS